MIRPEGEPVIRPEELDRAAVEVAWSAWAEAWTRMGGAEAMRYAIAAYLNRVYEDDAATKRAARVIHARLVPASSKRRPSWHAFRAGFLAAVKGGEA